MWLTLDLGSTCFKAGVFDAQLAGRGSASEAAPYVYDEAGAVEMPVHEVSEAIRRVIRAAMRSAEIQAEDLSGVGLTGQAQTFALSGLKNDPGGRFISWQDTRSAAEALSLVKCPALADFADQTGCGTLFPALLCAQLARLEERNRMRVLPLVTWLHEQWTGRAVLDDNQAAMTGLYALGTGTWWAPMVQLLGLGEEALPFLCQAGTVSGHTTFSASTWGLPQGLPVLMAGNDQTAGAVGAGIGEGMPCLVTLGTAQVAYQWCPELPEAAPDRFRGRFPGGGAYHMSADSLGGNLVNLLENLLQGCETDDAFFRQAASPGADAGRVQVVQNRDQPDTHVSINGLGPGTQPREIARAALVFLVDRMRDRIRSMAFPSGQKVLLAGGGSRQPLWCDLLTKALACECQPTEASPLLGTARLLQQQVSSHLLNPSTSPAS